MYRQFQFQVYGKVQGVWFRKYTQQEAMRLGIKGWVKNTSYGTVLGEAQGSVENMAVL